MTPDELAAMLAAYYGPNPQNVGADCDDDFDDLLTDAWTGLGHDADQHGPTWRRFEETASNSSATTFPAWLAELEAL